MTHSLNEADELNTKKSIISFIASNLIRFANRPDGDEKGLIMLVAALGVLNVSDDQAAINIARRLATSALIAKSKSKDG